VSSVSLKNALEKKERAVIYKNSQWWEGVVGRIGSLNDRYILEGTVKEGRRDELQHGRGKRGMNGGACNKRWRESRGRTVGTLQSSALFMVEGGGREMMRKLVSLAEKGCGLGRPQDKRSRMSGLGWGDGHGREIADRLDWVYGLR